MSAHAGPPPPPYQPAGPPQGPTIDISRTPAIPFVRLVQVELRKAVNTLSGFWLLAAMAVLLIIIEGFFLVVGLADDNAGLSFTIFTSPMAYVLQPMVATLTVMLVTSEWGQRTAMVTFAIEPKRSRVLYSKLSAAMMLAFALIVVLLVVALACSAILGAVQGDDFDWDFGVGDLLGLVVFQVLAVMLGYALATLILNTPAAIGAFPILMYAIPSGLGIIGLFWDDFGKVGPYLNLLTTQSPVLGWSLDSGTEWARLLVALGVWVVVPLVLGQTRVLKAEVK